MQTLYVMDVKGQNDPTLMQRLVLLFNRRQLQIKKLKAHESENRKYYYFKFVVACDAHWAERVARQIEKQTDVHSVKYETWTQEWKNKPTLLTA